MPANPLLTAALEYAALGWWIFPLQPRSKDPYWGTTGSLMASKNPDLIRAWWQCWPTANIALATGQARARLLLVDFDVRPDKGIDATEYYLAHTDLFPPTCINLTSGGGFQLPYILPEGVTIRNSASTKLAPGVDVRGEGGYVLAPPSIHPSGHVYAWAPGPPDCLPAPIAPLLHAALCPPPPDARPLPDAAQRVPSRYLVEWALRHIGYYGGRNNAGWQLACQVLDNGYTGSEGERVMSEYQRQCPGGDYTDREARQTWTSAERNHTPRQPWPDRRGPRTTPPPDPGADLASLRRLAP